MVSATSAAPSDTIMQSTTKQQTASGDRLKALMSQHVVKKGETIAKIAKQYGVRPTELVKANPQFRANSLDGRSSPTKEKPLLARNIKGRDADYIIASEKLRLPSAATATQKLPAAKNVIASAKKPVAIAESMTPKTSVMQQKQPEKVGVSQASGYWVNFTPLLPKDPIDSTGITTAPQGHSLEFIGRTTAWTALFAFGIHRYWKAAPIIWGLMNAP